MKTLAVKTTGLLLAMALVAGFCPARAFAQKEKQKEAKELKRPSDVGDSNVDGFVNQSFDIYEGTMKTGKDLVSIEESMNKIEAEGNKIKEDASIAQKLYGIQKEVRGRQAKIKTLDDKAKKVLEGAKSISPKTKSIKAVKNTNAAIKALNVSKERQPEQVSKTNELLGRATGKEQE